MANGRQTGSLVPSQVLAVISHTATGIVHVVEGYAADTAVDIERGEAAWTHVVGTDGFLSRVHNIDETATATFHLQQTATTNDVFTRIYEYDKNDLRGGGMFSISILDKSGRTALFSTQAFVSMLPNQSFGNAVNTQDWQVILPYSDWHIGGNTKAGAEVQAVLSALGYTLDEDWVIN